MGGHSSSTNTYEKEIHNKDITQRNNHVESQKDHYVEHNIETNILNGDKAYGGGVATNGDLNLGTAIYKLVNLKDVQL